MSGTTEKDKLPATKAEFVAELCRVAKWTLDGTLTRHGLAGELQRLSNAVFPWKRIPDGPIPEGNRDEGIRAAAHDRA